MRISQKIVLGFFLSLSVVSCLSGWESHGDKCFYFPSGTEIVQSYAEGMAKCAALNKVATLATVADEEEQNWITGGHG